MAGGGGYSFLSESQSALLYPHPRQTLAHTLSLTAQPTSLSPSLIISFQRHYKHLARVRRQRSPHHGQVVSPPDELPAVLRAENESLACLGLGLGVGVVHVCV